MSIKKKIFWPIYDADTAIGINNEGALVFSYELEDTDHLQGGADIFNGQESVVWNNIRDAFGEELKAMYQTLRSTGALSYAKVEQMFEEHQDKWPEAIFNEDAWFKYIDPLVEDGDGAYLDMLQGSKAEQRKWWLYNRFRYIDSKYNAGDALSDLIQLRGYAKSNITVIPYADIYPAVKYGSYLVTERGKRLVATTLVCPLDNVNDTEIYIYSSSQLASVGDLSGFKVGFANFAMATRLQEIKIGDSDLSYSNPNLASLTLGNNVLLKKLDVRNCTGLGDTTVEGHTQTAVDISGCEIIEEVYFDGTKIQGLTLPNGGVLKKLHVPGTMTNLTIMNQKNITEFVIPSYSNISTLRLENVPTLNTKAIMNAVSANTRVRLIGFYWTAENATEIEALLDKLDTMRGLDEQGNNVETAQVSGEIHTSSLTGAQIASYNARYPYLRVTADHTSAVLSYYNGSTLITTETVLDGGNGSYSGSTPTKTSTAQYNYTFSGWSKGSDDGTVDSDALTNVVADRSVYACFTATTRTYTVYWKNGSTTIETDTNVPYGTVPHYDGATPTSGGQTSTGWLPDPTQPITGDTTFVAQYLPVYTVTFKNDTGTTTLDTQNVVQCGTATYGGTTPTSSEDASLTWLGWATAANSHTANAVLTNVQSNMTVYAAFEAGIEVAEIADSWDQIIAKIDNGTYKTAYKIGNYKPLDLGTEGTINMQIVAMDADELADGSGYAPLTFVAMELLATKAERGTYWFGTNTIREHLHTNILPLIPSGVASRIQTVIKYTRLSTSYPSAAYNKAVLWIPSCREVGLSGYAQSGPVYNEIFKDANSRKRTRNNAFETWWLRDNYSNSGNGDAQQITSSGINSSSSPNSLAGVCLGFCLGLEPETITDDWSTILANQNYATDYSIGDTKYLDLGTEGKHLMEIVAFNEDDRADGNGKAGITWISKTLLNTQHRMNPAKSPSSAPYTEGTGSIGGWSMSEMRTYILDTIASKVPSTVMNGVVEVKKYTRKKDTSGSNVNNVESSETLWLPSLYEIFGSPEDAETQGATYSTHFPNVTSRLKHALGTKTPWQWWLRSSLAPSSFAQTASTGRASSADSQNAYGRIALGFCTN